MEKYPNKSPLATLHWKTILLMSLGLFVLAPSFVSCATSSMPPATALRYPAIIIYIGSG